MVRLCLTQGMYQQRRGKLSIAIMFFTVLTERQQDGVHGILIDLQSNNR